MSDLACGTFDVRADMFDILTEAPKSPATGNAEGIERRCEKDQNEAGGFCFHGVVLWSG